MEGKTWLILAPLLFLSLIALLSQLGLSEVVMQGNLGSNFNSTWTASADGTYDIGGHQLLNEYNRPTGEYGLTFIQGRQEYWLNSTNAYDIGYPHSVDIFSRDTSYPCWQLANGEGLSAAAGSDLNVSISDTTLMMVAVIVGLVILAGIAGLRILGSGESDFSVSAIIKGGGFLTIWGILSLAASPLILSIAIFGIAFYFLLTVVYAVGCINSLGGS